MAARPPGAPIESPPQDGSRAGWQDIGATAYAAAVLVGLFVTVGVYLVATAIKSRADTGRIWWGAGLIGLGAFAAVTGIILTLRRAMLPEPSRTRPSGKVEV